MWVCRKQSTTLCRLEERFHVVVKKYSTSLCRLEDHVVCRKQSTTLCRLEGHVVCCRKQSTTPMQARGTFFTWFVENRVPLLCRPRGTTWVVEIEYHSMQARGTFACGCRKQSYHSMQARGTFSHGCRKYSNLSMQARGTRGCRKQSTTLCRLEDVFYVVVETRVPLYVGQRTRGLQKIEYHFYVGQRGHVVVEIGVPL